MKYLLDTHALLWFLRETHYLPPAVLRTIEDAGSEAVVSLASLWEIAIKVSLDKLYLPKPFDELFPHSVPDSGVDAVAHRTSSPGCRKSVALSPSGPI